MSNLNEIEIVFVMVTKEHSLNHIEVKSDARDMNVNLSEAAAAAIKAVERMTSPNQMHQFRRISVTNESAFREFCASDIDLYETVMLADAIGYPIYAIVSDDGSISRILIHDTVHRRNANGFRETVAISKLHEPGVCDLISENAAKNFIKVNK